jgi:hypothetical protein
MKCYAGPQFGCLENMVMTNDLLGRATAQAVSRWLPARFASGQYVGFVVDKAALGQVLSEYFGFPCQPFHQFLLIILTRGWRNRPIGGRSAEWTQLDSPPPLY